MPNVLMVAPYAAEILEHLGEIPAGVDIATAASLSEVESLLGDAPVLITLPHWLSQAVLDRAHRLEWLQALSAGIDPLAGLDLGRVVLTTMGGVHAPQMSELAFLYMLAFARDLRGVFARQAAATWQQEPQRLLAGAQVVIVGVGRIAETLARRCRAFDMKVTGVSGSRREAPGFDRILPQERLTEAAASADYLIVLAPYSQRTHHLVSRDVLAALPRTAVLINIARGAVVDETALIEVLEHERIAGAGLDVFTHEPLPAEHPFWRMRNVILTPHIGGWNVHLAQQLAPLVADNMGRWFGTPRRPLLNQVMPPL